MAWLLLKTILSVICINMCVCVCICVTERDRARAREGGGKKRDGETPACYLKGQWERKILHVGCFQFIADCSIV